jgi:hypothetical protein
MHEGETSFAWHFLTDQGHHYMIETRGRALMLDGARHVLVQDLALDDHVLECDRLN